MPPLMKSSPRGPRSRIELDKQVKELIVEINELSALVATNQNSLETMQRIVVRDTNDLKTWYEDLSTVLGATCVDLKMYRDYKEMIAETKRKLGVGNFKISELTSTIKKQRAQLGELKRSADTLVSKLNFYGKVIPIWRK